MHNTIVRLMPSSILSGMHARVHIGDARMIGIYAIFFCDHVLGVHTLLASLSLVIHNLEKILQDLFVELHHQCDNSWIHQLDLRMWALDVINIWQHDVTRFRQLAYPTPRYLVTMPKSDVFRHILQMLCPDDISLGDNQLDDRGLCQRSAFPTTAFDEQPSELFVTLCQIENPNPITLNELELDWF